MREFLVFLLTQCSYHGIICSYMSISSSSKLEQLQFSFPKLTEANQQFILGIATGLKYLQGKYEEASGVGKKYSAPWLKLKEI